MRSPKAVRLGIVLATALAATSAVVASRPAHAGGYFEVSVGFYDTLAPYGEWFELYGVGTVWRPYTNQVGADFYPYYTGGSWVYSEYGWTWASDYSWGWVPFHHGRWIYSETYGWVWIPGDEWAPAWVEWRYGGGYIGWVPLGWGSYQVVGIVSSPWCWYRTDDFGRRDWRSRRLYGSSEVRAYHASAPVPPNGRTPVGPPPAGLPSAPPTIQLGRPQGLRPGDVELEKRLQRPPTPRSRDSEFQRPVGPPRGDVGPPPGERPPRDGMNPPPFGDRSRREVAPPPPQQQRDDWRPPPRDREPQFGGPRQPPPPQQLAPPPPQGQPPPPQQGTPPPARKGPGPHPGAVGGPPRGPGVPPPPGHR